MAITEKALRESIIAHGAQLVEAGFGGDPVIDISARFAELDPHHAERRSIFKPAARHDRLDAARRRIWRLGRADEAVE